MRTNKLFAMAVFAFCSAFTVLSQTWTQTSLPPSQWRCFASSADGNKLVAETTPNLIYVSTNGGVTWSTNILPVNASWVSVVSSADGTKLATASVDGIICTSTNSGITWATNNVPAAAWYSIASSADGAKLTVAAGGGQTTGPIYVSTNFGSTWLRTSAPSNYWRSVASSADGTKLVAGSNPGPVTIYTSTNSGITWRSNSLPINKQWTVACSADGNKMVAAYYADGPSIPGHIFTSADSGSTWVSNQFVSSYFESVALSADGNKIVAGTQDAVVCISTNFGFSWSSNSLSGGGSYFQSVALSADGGKAITGSLFFTFFASGLGLSYISQSVSAPQLNLAPANTSLVLSWTIPSTNFVLQQSSNLIAWAEVTNLPILNLTNLKNQVTLPQSVSNSFYRLKTP